MSYYNIVMEHHEVCLFLKHNLLVTTLWGHGSLWQTFASSKHEMLNLEESTSNFSHAPLKQEKTHKTYLSISRINTTNLLE